MNYPDRWKVLEDAMGQSNLIDMSLIESAEATDWAKARSRLVREESTVESYYLSCSDDK